MGTLKRQRNAFGKGQAKYKTGSTNGGFGTNPANVKKGSALTPSDNDEVALAGLNDLIIGFVDEVDTQNGMVRYLYDYEIQDILTDGTVAVGSKLVGASDTNRGLAKGAAGPADATYSDPTSPTVAELKTAITALQAAFEISNNARWVVKSATSGKATVVP